MGSVTVTAAELLSSAVEKSGRKSSVQLPAQFARIQKHGDTSTPLSRMFTQGEVTLKLYLTLVMLTRQEPHSLYRIRPDHYWAGLLGYEELNDADPIPGNGTRRIKRAMRNLEKGGPDETGWITRTRVPGRGFEITVVHPPGPMVAPYITAPIQLWSRGWINVMSARALFVYVCLRLVLAGKDDDHGAHVSAWDRKRFAIGDDTWQRGMKELVALQLARSETDRVTANRWSSDLSKRKVKVYYLNNTYLLSNDSPTEPVDLS
ncbi:hypothetical protein C5613_41470 [Rhodococcus opacus]|uniref:Replication protein n=1 Tax=Rhodococcus opacus TaxID=37919 RepID=A0A2S8II44_RHOOP|nr:hypothetical protein C5613_41470 [Rhodococcus opacus]